MEAVKQGSAAVGLKVALLRARLLLPVLAAVFCCGVAAALWPNTCRPNPVHLHNENQRCGAEHDMRAVPAALTETQ